jgi:hypothetical protein
MKALDFETWALNESAGLGDCYEAAGNLILPMFGDKHKNYTLVHGMVNGQGQLQGIRYGHAWVEDDSGNVLDHSNRRKIKMDAKVYYAIGGIEKSNNIYYTQEEARKWILKSKHWGPWEMSGDPVSLTENIPGKKKEIGDAKKKLSRKELQTIEEYEI